MTLKSQTPDLTITRPNASNTNPARNNAPSEIRKLSWSISTARLGV
jgi:hypothetical protein